MMMMMNLDAENHGAEDSHDRTRHKSVRLPWGIPTWLYPFFQPHCPSTFYWCVNCSRHKHVHWFYFLLSEELSAVWVGRDHIGIFFFLCFFLFFHRLKEGCPLAVRRHAGMRRQMSGPLLEMNVGWVAWVDKSNYNIPVMMPNLLCSLLGACKGGLINWKRKRYSWIWPRTI